MLVLVSVPFLMLASIVGIGQIAALVDDGRAADQHGRSGKQKNGSSFMVSMSLNPVNPARQTVLASAAAGCKTVGANGDLRHVEFAAANRRRARQVAQAWRPRW